MKDGLLSMEALEWLKEQGYESADHETRLRLIREAKELDAELYGD